LNDKIITVSDTKLTYEHLDRNNPKDGTIKSIIITPQISVSYAGDIHFAELALKGIGTNSDVDFIKRTLLSFHISSDLNTDFILSKGGKTPCLYVFKNGEMTKATIDWIGSSEGFNRFQKAFNDPTNGPIIEGVNFNIIKMPDEFDHNFNEVTEKMIFAMKEVIEDTTIPEVGGFFVCTSFNEQKFKYINYISLFRNPIEIKTFDESKGWNVIDFSSVKEGAFSVNFLESESDTLAIHFFHGNIGLIYKRENNGLLNPEVIVDVDEIDFSEYLNNCTDLRFGITMGHNYDNYAYNGEQALKLNDFELAIKRFDIALNLAAKSWKPKLDDLISSHSIKELRKLYTEITIPNEQKDFLHSLFLLRGQAYLQLNKFNEAAKDIEDALIFNASSLAALYYLGISSLNNQNYVIAEKAFTQFLELEKNAEIFYLRGESKRIISNIEGAIFDYDLALKMNPNHGGALRSKALLNN